MVGVFVLHLKRSSSSDSPNKACVVHILLSITVTWRGVDEPTPETPFLFIKKKNKKKKKKEEEEEEENNPVLNWFYFSFTGLLESR